MRSKSFFLTIAGTLMLVSGKVDAGRIVWGNSITPDSNFQSNGIDSLDTGFIFALGTFADTDTGGGVLVPFTPDGTNVSLWDSSWRELDTAPYNTADDYFTGETDLLNDANLGKTTYIWIYNTRDPKLHREWMLVTGKKTAPWNVPAFENGQTNFPSQFYITGPDIDVIFGRFDDPGPNPPSTGLGELPGTPTSYILQTGAIPIPEPAMSGLLAAGLFGCLRRRRDKTAVPG